MVVLRLARSRTVTNVSTAQNQLLMCTLCTVATGSEWVMKRVTTATTMQEMDAQLIVRWRPDTDVKEEMLPLRTHAHLRVEMECSKEQRTVTTATQRTMTGVLQSALWKNPIFALLRAVRAQRAHAETASGRAQKTAMTQTQQTGMGVTANARSIQIIIAPEVLKLLPMTVTSAVMEQKKATRNVTTTTVTVVTVVVDHAWSSLVTAAQRVQASITMFAPRTTERYFDVTLVGTISWPFIMRIQSVEHW